MARKEVKSSAEDGGGLRESGKTWGSLDWLVCLGESQITKGEVKHGKTGGSLGWPVGGWIGSGWVGLDWLVWVGGSVGGLVC